MERRLFLQMMYQLLLTGRMPFKARKIMCVGESDSGKTTWIEPILACLDEDKVVAVTDEGKFSTQSLQSDTQLLMMDEFSPGKIDFILVHYFLSAISILSIGISFRYS